MEASFTAAAAVVFLSVATAHAATVTTTTLTLYDSSFSSTYTPITGHSGNHPKITDDLKSSYTIKDNTPITENFFTAAPNSSSGLTCSGAGKPACDVVEGTISLTLDFTLMETVTTTTTGKNGKKTTTATKTTLGSGLLSDVTGAFYANYDGTYSTNPCTDSGTKTDCIIWSGEKDGSLTDYVQLGDDLVLEVILADAQDWDITPKISFEIMSSGSGNQGSTPLPPALPLFAAGIAVLSFASYRRKGRAAKVRLT